MPLFIFITGYFAKFKPKKIILSLIYPYFLFQFLYIFFQQTLLHDLLPMQFTTPDWILWYLLAVIVYYCLIPFIDTDRKGLRIIIFFIAVAMSLLAGYDDSIGYYLSLSRILTFLPYFILGYYCRSANKTRFSLSLSERRIHTLIILISLILVGLSSCRIYFSETINANILYGSYSYSAAGYNWFLKALLLLIGLSWIVFALAVTPDKKLPIISTIGADTFPIYLLHGFLIYLIKPAGIFGYFGRINILLAFVIALAIVVLLGNKYVTWVFRRCLPANGSIEPSPG